MCVVLSYVCVFMCLMRWYAVICVCVCVQCVGMLLCLVCVTL